MDEILYILELANLQLAELEAYDRILDTALERSYRDLTRQPRRSREVMRELREIRVDLARFSDELSNITKFFGDWHLARLYENISARFHLGDWHRTIDEKLDTRSTPSRSSKRIALFHLVDRLNSNEQNKRNDQKIQSDCKEIAVGENRASFFCVC